MSALVRVLAARRCGPEAEAVAIADVELDGLVTVRAVELVNDDLGRTQAVAPRRAWGDEARVLAWSSSVSEQIVSAVQRQLGDRVAFAADPELDLARGALAGDRLAELAVPAHELPQDPDGRMRVTDAQLVEAVAQAPGITRAALAERFGLAGETIRRRLDRLVELGRVTAELDGSRALVYCVEGPA